MGEAICHHEGSYLIWSSVTDTPILYNCTEQDIKDHVRREYGQSGMRDIDRRLDRARLIGTSSMMHGSLRDMVLGNHAGPNGEEITYDDVIRFYFVEKREPDHTATFLDPARFDI